jgi:tetratricopeptide (TPR) repeat protein
MIPKSRGGKTMKSILGRSLKGLWGMGLIFLLLTPLARAEKGLEGMDLTALSKEAAQWHRQLDRNPSDYEALQGLGIVTHYMAVKDSKGYAKKAVQFLEQAHNSRPDDYTVLGCLGSAYTLMARDAGSPADRADFFNKGVEYMDKAVRKDPNNFMVRMIRANNAKGMPRFLNRRSIAYEDFEYLAGLFEKDQKFPSPLKTSVYRQLAALYQEDGDQEKSQKHQAMAKTINKEH